MSKWNVPDTGILRKKSVPENHDDLLVFGYACKLFRDDDKAKYIDQGKHLIPWMGDEALRIDRYDGRGALSDLKPYEASREGYDAMRWLGLNESERKIEQLCDEERYHTLNSNEEEEEMYKEEEVKRKQKTNEFAYSYDVPQNPEVSQNLDLPMVEEEDKDYVPRPELDVPVDIAIPKKEKENARIQKTALFVSKQGPQMEILIKTKQANNPQFSFLNQDNPLYKYYKHVLNALKSGSYKLESTTEEEHRKEDLEQDSNEGNYLHPSLLQASVQMPAPTIPTVTYKPTADCTYSQLVNRIQGSQGDGFATAHAKQEPPLPQSAHQQNNHMTYEQQYYQYYYSMQYYEYYKQLVQQFHSMGGTDGQTIPQVVQEQITAQAATLAQMGMAQYMQQNSSNPYAQIASNVSQVKENSNFYPTTNVEHQQIPVNTTPESDGYKQDGSFSQTHTAAPSVIGIDNTLVEGGSQPVQEEKKVEKKLLSLVYYSSGSEDEEEADDNGENSVQVPPEDTKMVIDKMASYVAKNGSDFEKIVKSKGDARFEFLHEEHVYYRYYKEKIAEFSGEKKPEVKSEKVVPNGASNLKSKDKKAIVPVSFSIKKPKEEITKEIKSALPLEESDEDISEDTQSKAADSVPTIPLVAVPQVVKEVFVAKEPAEVSPLEKGEEDKCDVQKNGEAETDDPILEMINLTEDIEEKKDARRAEDRIKDKLAAAAREKLALVAKDKALQLERRKKAAAFLKMRVQPEKVKVKEVEKADEDKVVLVISDTENKAQKVRSRRRSRSRTKEKRAKQKDDSESEEGEIKKRKSKKKKSYHHKRKRSRSRHRCSSGHKKSKKKRRRSVSNSSNSSQN